MSNTPSPRSSEKETISFWRHLRKHPRWRIITESTILATLLLLVTLLYAFIEIVEEIGDHTGPSFDAAILRWFRDPADMKQTIGPSWLQTAAQDVTALGGTTVLIIVVLVTIGFLGFAKKSKAMLLVAAAAIGGQIFNSSLKIFFGRPRPDIVPHLAEVHTASFPSGHSMMSAVIYLTLGALLSRLVSGTFLRAYIMGVALFLTFAVGVTRVFLGVHYPTDVLAGWSAGLAWALLCLLVAQLLQHKGKVEQPGEHTQIPLPHYPSSDKKKATDL